MTTSKYLPEGWNGWDAITGVKTMNRIQFWEWFAKQSNQYQKMFKIWDEVTVYKFILDRAKAKKVVNMHGLWQDAGLYVSRWAKTEDMADGIKIVDEIISLIRKGVTPNATPWNRKLLEPKPKKNGGRKETPKEIFRKYKNFPKDVSKEFYNEAITTTVKQLWESMLDLDPREYLKEALAVTKERVYTDIQESIKGRFKDELLEVDAMDKNQSIDYTGKVIHDGKESALTLHQKLIAVYAKKHTGFIDLADAGAGKSDAVLNTISYLDTKINVIIAPASIINNKQWQRYISNAFKNASIYMNKDVFSKSFTRNINRDRRNNRRVFYLVSYSFVSGQKGQTILNRLQSQNPDFICIDEGQRTKVRDETKKSKCRIKIQNMLTKIRTQSKRIKVLMLTATPVPNTVSEAKSLVDLVIGKKREFNKISTFNSLQNMAEMHVALGLHSLRYAKRYKNKRGNPIKCITETHKVSANYNLKGSVKSMRDQSFLGLEQIALEAKLPYMMKELKKRKNKVIIFTKFVTGIVPRIAEACEENGITYTFYTGSDKRGLDSNAEFFNGAQVLIASAALSEGIDRLQDYCHELWIVSQGWTHTEQEQTKGRIYRTGQEHTVRVLIIEATVNGVEYDKVVKSNRISYKGKIHDIVTNGLMPNEISLPDYTIKKIIDGMIIGQPRNTRKKLPDKVVKRLEKIGSGRLKARERRKHDKKKK